MTTFLRALSSLIILGGLAVSSFGAIVWATSLPDEDWAVLVFGLLVILAGALLLALVSFIQLGIDEFKASRGGEPAEEFTAAQLISMYKDEAEAVRDLLKGGGPDDDTR